MQQYQRGNSSGGTGYNKSSTSGAATTGGAKKTFTPSPKGTKPSHNLSILLPGENQKIQKVTGLFASETKDGRAYSKVTLKEGLNVPEGTQIFVMPNDYEERNKK